MLDSNPLPLSLGDIVRISKSIHDDLIASYESLDPSGVWKVVSILPGDEFPLEIEKVANDGSSGNSIAVKVDEVIPMDNFMIFGAESK